jgi:hypothetical protein
MSELRKYPRTPHIEGSCLAGDDRDFGEVPFASLAGRHLVVEEKLDGANAAVSFGRGGELRLQSRGHFLEGGPRERHFAPLKAWANRHRDALWERLGSRSVLYGEWLFAKHTIFYDALPHLFLEFDVLDLETGGFLSTPARRALLSDTPVVSVPVLHDGPLPSLEALVALVGRSGYKTASWRQRLDAVAAEHGLDVARVRAETDASDLAEGVYVKTEEGGEVTGRFKWVRASFLAAVDATGTHWFDRPIVPNGLRDGADLYAA